MYKHGQAFPQLFLKSVYETCKTKIVNYLSTASTGRHPPINIIADKATRQFVALTTITPGGPQFVQSVFLDAPPVKRELHCNACNTCIHAIHRAGLVDSHIRDSGQVECLVSK